MKKFLVNVCVVGLLAGILTGCGSKEVISKKSFAETVSEYSYQVKDQSKMIAEGSDLKTVYLAIPKKEDTEKKEESENVSHAQNQIEFYEFTSEKAGKEHFKKLSDELVAAYKNEKGYETNETSVKNGEMRVVETEKQYYRLSRIEDTLVVGIAPKEQQKDCEKILNDLGY